MKVGDKVVCIGNFFCPMPHPKKGNIYTIEQIRPANRIINKGRMYYTLTGLNWLGTDGNRCQWETVGFRPVQLIDLWNRDEQESYLEYVEQIAPGVERETVEK